MTSIFLMDASEVYQGLEPAILDVIDECKERGWSVPQYMLHAEELAARSHDPRWSLASHDEILATADFLEAACDYLMRQRIHATGRSLSRVTAPLFRPQLEDLLSYAAGHSHTAIREKALELKDFYDAMPWYLFEAEAPREEEEGLVPRAP